MAFDKKSIDGMIADAEETFTNTISDLSAIIQKTSKQSKTEIAQLARESLINMKNSIPVLTQEELKKSVELAEISNIFIGIRKTLTQALVKLTEVIKQDEKEVGKDASEFIDMAKKHWVLYMQELQAAWEHYDTEISRSKVEATINKGVRILNELDLKINEIVKKEQANITAGRSTVESGADPAAGRSTVGSGAGLAPSIEAKEESNVAIKQNNTKTT